MFEKGILSGKRMKSMNHLSTIYYNKNERIFQNKL